jgi:hypothetical protein
MVEIKKPEDVAVATGGAATMGTLDWLLEDACYRYNMHNKFPYVAPIPQLPPVDDWALLGTSLATLGVGELIKNKDVANFGLGATLYTGAMMLHHTLLRSITWPMAGIPYGAPATPPRVTPPAPTVGKYVVKPEEIRVAAKGRYRVTG